MDELQEKFLNYQLHEKSDVPDVVWNEALVYEEGADKEKQYHRMDMIWGCITNVTKFDSSCRFLHLSKVAKLMVIIAHSNAKEERLFNLIKQNKIPTHSSLHINGTMSSITQVNLENKDSCVAWEPPEELCEIGKGGRKTVK